MAIDPAQHKDIVEDAYDTIADVETERADIMDELKTAASGGETSIDIGNSTDIDVSTGAGALVLDNYLQELSTLEQSAAQIVAQANKAQKSVHSQTGQM